MAVTEAKFYKFGCLETLLAVKYFGLAIRQNLALSWPLDNGVGFGQSNLASRLNLALIWPFWLQLPNLATLIETFE